MKKYIIVVSLIIAILFAFDYAYYHLGWYIPLGEKQPEIFIKTEDKSILINKMVNLRILKLRALIWALRFRENGLPIMR